MSSSSSLMTERWRHLWLSRLFVQWKEQWLARLYRKLRTKSKVFEAWLRFCAQQKERRPSCVQSAVVTRRSGAKTPTRSGSTPPPPPPPAPPPTPPSHPPLALEDIFYDLDESSFYKSPVPGTRPQGPEPITASPSPSPKSAAHLPAPYQKVTIHPRHAVWKWDEEEGEEDEDMSRPEEVSAQRLRKGKSLRVLVNPKRASGRSTDMADGLYFGKLCRGAMMRLHMLVAMSSQRPPMAGTARVQCDLFERQWGYQAAFTMKKKQVEAFRRVALDGLLPRWHKWALVETWIKHEYGQATTHDRMQTLSKGWGMFFNNIAIMTQQHQLTVAAKCLSREHHGTRFLAKLQRRVATTRDATSALSRVKSSPFGTTAQRALRRWRVRSQCSVDRYILLFDLAALATNALERRKKWQAMGLWVALLARRAKRRIAWVPEVRSETRIVDWAARMSTPPPYWIPTKRIELGVEHRIQNDRLTTALKSWSGFIRQRRKQARCYRRGTKASIRLRTQGLRRLLHVWKNNTEDARLAQKRLRVAELERKKELLRLEMRKEAVQIGLELAKSVSMQAKQFAWFAWKKACTTAWFQQTNQLKRGLRKWLRFHVVRRVNERFDRIGEGYFKRRALSTAFNHLVLGQKRDFRRISCPSTPLSDADSLYYISSSDSERGTPSPPAWTPPQKIIHRRSDIL